MDELRLQAIKITKEKASKLLNAVNENVGEVVTIIEGSRQINDGVNGYRYPHLFYGSESRNGMDMANTSSSEGTGNGNGPLSPRNIKMRAEMTVVYKIK
jgi:uncharacterized protein YggE